MTSTSASSRKNQTLSKIASNRLQKELVEWQVNPPASFKHKPTDNLQRWVIEVRGAPGTLYANETFQLEVDFPGHYPMEAPQVIFLHPAPLHPHIYSNGHICLGFATETKAKGVVLRPYRKSYWKYHVKPKKLRYLQLYHAAGNTQCQTLRPHPHIRQIRYPCNISFLVFFLSWRGILLFYSIPLKGILERPTQDSRSGFLHTAYFLHAFPEVDLHDILYDSWSPAMTVSSICISILSMLSSSTVKQPPEDNDRYVRNCKNGRSPKETRWWFHDDKV